MFTSILDEIKKFDTITIYGHVNPDGDCYGAQIALRDSLRLSFPHKRVYAVGSGCPLFYDLIGEMDCISLDLIHESLAILVDSNDFTRSEDHRIKEAKQWIKIDHHVDTGLFTQGKSFVNEKASSTCEIILDFITFHSLSINKRIANALFLGILTDTARFQYVDDFSKSFKQASFLCDKGASPDDINKLLNINDERFLSFKGFVFSNYIKTKSGVIYLKIDRIRLEELGISSAIAGSMVNLISNLRNYPIWAFFCENKDGTCHAELRSNGPAVQPVALKYGGGGHLLAAGVTLDSFSDEIIDKVVHDLNSLLI